MDINYERREGRREQAIEVDPDAHDTYSELISSIAIVGEFKTRKEGFVQSFKSDLEPRQPHDDAPEFQLNLSIKGELSRSEYAQAVNGLCKKKNLSPTPQTVSTLAGICDSLYEAASALNRLQPKDDAALSTLVRFDLRCLISVPTIFFGTRHPRSNDSHGAAGRH